MFEPCLSYQIALSSKKLAAILARIFPVFSGFLGFSGFFIFLAGFFSVVASAPASAEDDISVAARSVVRVVTIAMAEGGMIFGHGSGIAITPTRILTNAHVVEAMVYDPETVALGVVPSQGQKSYAAKLITIDLQRDLAIIEVTGGQIAPTVVYTGPVEAGDDVIALGYPGNVDMAGARSAEAYITPHLPVRSEGDVAVLQPVAGIATLLHTAKIARGSSGGPLVDECGRVVGINSFITRADDGDSPFAFAVSARELVHFLNEARQSFTSVATQCLTIAEAETRDRAAHEVDARKKAAAHQIRNDAARFDRQRRESRAVEAALATRENHMAAAVVLFVFAAMVALAAFMLHQRGRFRARTATGVGALGLVILSAFLYFTRPALPDLLGSLGAADAAGRVVGSSRGVRSPASVLSTPIGATSPESELELTPGDFICSIRIERSRITVSDIAAPDVQDVGLSIDAKGCLNRKSQYVPSADGRWQHIMLPGEPIASTPSNPNTQSNSNTPSEPNAQAKVSIASFSPEGPVYRVEHYRVSAAILAKVQRLRGSIDSKTCTASSAARDRLALQQEAIRAALPERPNEWLVYGCVKGRLGRSRSPE